METSIKPKELDELQRERHPCVDQYLLHRSVVAVRKSDNRLDLYLLGELAPECEVHLVIYGNRYGPEVYEVTQEEQVRELPTFGPGEEWARKRYEKETNTSSQRC